MGNNKNVVVKKACHSQEFLSGMTPLCNNRGFTLLEILVVVLIIGVFAAVAVPQYKRAVLKSRFHTVMPVAKAVADAQEVYYLTNNQYALSKDDLDVPHIDSESTEVKLSTAAEEDNYVYVAAKHKDLPNARYITYQQHSPKFAGNIHCEAKAAADEENEEVWLCRDALQGQEVAGSVQGTGYRTFRLTGQAGDSFAEGGSGDNNDEPGGNSEPGVNPQALAAKLQTVANEKCPEGSGYECIINSNGTVSRCYTLGAQIIDGECIPKTNGYDFETIFDEDGNRVQNYWCNESSAGKCTALAVDSLLDNGKWAHNIVKCSNNQPITKDLTCPTGNYSEREYVIKNQYSQRESATACWGSDINAEGACTTYTHMSKRDNTYTDVNNNGYVTKKCMSVSGLTCANDNYQPTSAYYVTYDGSKRLTYDVTCGGTIGTDGSCSSGWSAKLYTNGKVTGNASCGNSKDNVDWTTGTCK